MESKKLPNTDWRNLRTDYLTKDRIIQRLFTDYTYYMTPEDAQNFYIAKTINFSRPFVGIFLGVLTSYTLKRTAFMKKFVRPQQKLIRFGLGMIPAVYVISNTPSRKYLRLSENLYLKYYKAVSEDLIKEDKLNNKIVV